MLGTCNDRDAGPSRCHHQGACSAQVGHALRQMCVGAKNSCIESHRSLRFGALLRVGISNPALALKVTVCAAYVCATHAYTCSSTHERTRHETKHTDTVLQQQ